jgi:hypothetical protein
MNARGLPQRPHLFFCRVLYFGGRLDLTMLDTFATLTVSLAFTSHPTLNKRG